MVNNPSANAGETKETGIQFLGWEDPLEGLENPTDGGACSAIVHRITKRKT